MFALLEIERIYKTLKLFADLQGPICYKDQRDKFVEKETWSLRLQNNFLLSLWPGQKSA